MDETHARTRSWRERSEAGAGTDGIRLRRHGFRSARMAARLRFPRNRAPIQKPDLRSLLRNEVAAAQAVLTGSGDPYSALSARRRTPDSCTRHAGNAHPRVSGDK